MIDLGCVEAMNLDGGGSTQMAFGDKYINVPSEYRAVPSILAVVHSDSLHLPKEPLFEKIIDTKDKGATAMGKDWFPTNNPGFYGVTPSLLHKSDNDTANYVFSIDLAKKAEYEIYG